MLRGTRSATVIEVHRVFPCLFFLLKGYKHAGDAGHAAAHVGRAVEDKPSSACHEVVVSPRSRGQPTFRGRTKVTLPASVFPCVFFVLFYTACISMCAVPVFFMIEPDMVLRISAWFQV